MRSFLLVPVLLVFSVTASAATLFSDNFESGSLSALRWVSGSQGVVALDPLQADRALKFTGLQAGGDLLSVAINNASGAYILSFDYLGTCTHQDCGGFIGHEPGDVWDFGSQTGYPTTASPLFLVDDGQWHHYSVALSAGPSLQLQLEDYSGSGGIAGDAWFDNIRVTDQTSSVPEPATALCLGLGLAGLAWSKSRSR